MPEGVELEVDIDEDAPALLDWFAGIDDLIRMPDTWLGTDVIGEVANPGGWFGPPKFFSPGHVCSNGKRGAKLCMCMHEPPRCGAWQCSRSSLASGACTDGRWLRLRRVSARGVILWAASWRRTEIEEFTEMYPVGLREQVSGAQADKMQAFCVGH